MHDDSKVIQNYADAHQIVIEATGRQFRWWFYLPFSFIDKYWAAYEKNRRIQTYLICRVQEAMAAKVFGHNFGTRTEIPMQAVEK